MNIEEPEEYDSFRLYLWIMLGVCIIAYINWLM